MINGARHQIPLSSRSPVSRPRLADTVDVTFSHRTSVNGREYRSGDMARIPATVARGMYSTGSINCVDRSEPARRGFTRRSMSDAPEYRMATPWDTLNKILPSTSKPFPSSGPQAPAKPVPPPKPTPKGGSKGK
jgi:hypothetical protein